jgi:hypothetical protein
MRILLALALLWQNQPAHDPWQPLRFLIGRWEAQGGTYSFDLELKDHVLVRHSTNGDHADELYVYPEEQSFKAIYFDNEGHVIHYNVTATPSGAVFQSDQYRLSYELKNGVMYGKFEVGGKKYLEWSGKRGK